MDILRWINLIPVNNELKQVFAIEEKKSTEDLNNRMLLRKVIISFEYQIFFSTVAKYFTTFSQF